MIKYKFDKSEWRNYAITKIEIISETSSFITLKNGTREKKYSNYDAYLNTLENAKEYRRAYLEEKISIIKRSIARQEAEIEKMQNIIKE